MSKCKKGHSITTESIHNESQRIVLRCHGSRNNGTRHDGGMLLTAEVSCAGHWEVHGEEYQVLRQCCALEVHRILGARFRRCVVPLPDAEKGAKG